MKLKFLTLAGILLAAPGLLLGCSPNETATDTTTDMGEAEMAEESTEQAAAPEAEGTGTLMLVANGEDFVRQGFVTKDGWQIDFDNVYVNLADVTAYQTDPPYDPDSSEQLQAKEQVSLDEPKTVDLAEGGEDADPVTVAELQDVPAGNYNALAWEMTPATSGPAEGYTMVISGTAAKDGETVDFVIRSDQEVAYTCGEFVGDERKGILQADGQAEMESTFHFDHIFGDGEAPADDPINTGAVGFEPLANLAEGGQLEADMDMLESQLSPEDYATLEKSMQGLAHVGEGHCKETTPSA